METMKEKVVMITGAAAGIGLACAEAFAGGDKNEGCGIHIRQPSTLTLNFNQ